MLTILSFLPMEVIALTLILAALGTVVGIVRPRVVGGILLLLIVLPIAAGVLDSVVLTLPSWAILLLVMGACLSVGRVFLTLAIGRRAADGAIGHVVGEGIVGLFRLAIRVLSMPFRGTRA